MPPLERLLLKRLLLAILAAAVGVVVGYEVWQHFRTRERDQLEEANEEVSAPFASSVLTTAHIIIRELVAVVAYVNHTKGNATHDDIEMFVMTMGDEQLMKFSTEKWIRSPPCPDAGSMAISYDIGTDRTIMMVVYNLGAYGKILKTVDLTSVFDEIFKGSNVPVEVYDGGTMLHKTSDKVERYGSVLWWKIPIINGKSWKVGTTAPRETAEVHLTSSPVVMGVVFGLASFATIGLTGFVVLESLERQLELRRHTEVALDILAAIRALDFKQLESLSTSTYSENILIASLGELASKLAWYKQFLPVRLIRGRGSITATSPLSAPGNPLKPKRNSELLKEPCHSLHIRVGLGMTLVDPEVIANCFVSSMEMKGVECELVFTEAAEALVIFPVESNPSAVLKAWETTLKANPKVALHGGVASGTCCTGFARGTDSPEAGFAMLVAGGPILHIASSLSRFSQSEKLGLLADRTFVSQLNSEMENHAEPVPAYYLGNIEVLQNPQTKAQIYFIDAAQTTHKTFAGISESLFECDPKALAEAVKNFSGDTSTALYELALRTSSAVLENPQLLPVTYEERLRRVSASDRDDANYINGAEQG